MRPLLLLALLFSLPAIAADKKPNFLWLIAEDFGQHLGCYGTKEVTTPVLDGIAAKGMRFTRFYTTAPVCSASRSGFMTGMYSTSINAHNHRSHRDGSNPLPDGVRLITDWMRDAGYYTANVADLPADMGFKGAGKTDWNFNMPEKAFDSRSWDDLKSHQPFYAQINFQETHRTYHAPKHADPAKVELPPYYPDHPVTRADWAEYLDAATELDIKIGRILKQLEADGLADNTIIIFIGDNGQSHVRGKQFCYESGLLVPLLVFCPKGIEAPQGYTAGTVTDRLTAAIDLGPTMMSIVGVARPAKMEGRAFFGTKADAPRQLVFGARDRCDETSMRIRTVRDSRYRYIHNFTPEIPFFAPNAYKEKQYPVWNLMQELHKEGKLNAVQDVLCAPRMPDEELYDMTADPFEIHNLAGSDKPEDQAALTRLRGALDKWIKDTDDKGQYPEPPNADRGEKAEKKGKKKAKQ